MNRDKLKTSIIVLWILIFSTFLCYAQEIAVKNSSQYSRGQWNWTIYLDAPQQILRTIRYVDYDLYFSPSGPRTVRVNALGDPSRPWGYSGQSDGIFRLDARVRLQTGELKVYHHTLVLGFPSPAQPLDIRTGQRTKRISADWWSWTVYITADPNTLGQIQCVEYILHPTFQNPVRFIYEQGTGPYAFPLDAMGWGSFTVDIRVHLKNGQVQELSHYLSLRD